MLIKYLMNEKDENKRIYFNKLFNINFIECLNNFIGKKFIPELDGLKCLEDIKNEEIINKYPLDGERYFTINVGCVWYESHHRRDGIPHHKLFKKIMKKIIN